MENAKKFLRENSTESKAVAARIFNVNANSLISFIKRGSGQKNEGHNKILQNHEINALDDFIRSLLKHEILPTSGIVFSGIVGLKRAYRRPAFIPFEDEDEDESENAPHAENVGHAKHGNLRTNHSIDDEFNPGDFFDDIDDERAFETLYS